MLTTIIIFIILNLLLSLPIDEWKTKLKGKCSCYEILFGKYPIETQYYIIQNLQLDMNQDCLPISKDINIINIPGVKESIINSINSQVDLVSTGLNNEIVIFYSMLRLAYHANIERFDFINLYDKYLDLQRHLLLGIDERHRKLTLFLSFLHNPQNIICDKDIKLLPTSTDVIISISKQNLYYDYVKLLNFLFYKTKEKYSISFYEENYEQYNDLSVRNEVNNCTIYIFFNKTFSLYKSFTKSNNTNFLSDIKNYQGFHLEYREFIRSNYKSSNDLLSFFEEDSSLQDIIINESNYIDIIMNIKKNMPSIYDNSTESESDLLTIPTFNLNPDKAHSLLSEEFK